MIQNQHAGPTKSFCPLIILPLMSPFVAIDTPAHFDFIKSDTTWIVAGSGLNDPGR